jgi:predicted RNA-binding Zn ribbon-like protein
MTVPTLAPAGAPLPFKFVGGDPSIDLVNTVDWTSRGEVDERLTDYERLTRWAEGAGVVGARQASRLRALAAEHPRRAERAHRAALELRGRLRTLYTTLARGDRVDTMAELADFNASLAGALAQLEVAPATKGVAAASPLAWRWREAGDRLDSVLWPVLRSAAELLVSAEVARIRECGGEDCGWMYVDRSRNGLRRWCQMETCGTREKSRRRAARA